MITIAATRNSDLLASLNQDVQNLHHRLQPEIFKPWDHESIAAALKTPSAVIICKLSAGPVESRVSMLTAGGVASYASLRNMRCAFDAVRPYT